MSRRPVSVAKSSIQTEKEVLACPYCGSLEVEGQFWVRLNTSRVLGESHDDYWCPSCDLHFSRVCSYLSSDPHRTCLTCSDRHQVLPPPVAKAS